MRKIVVITSLCLCLFVAASCSRPTVLTRGDDKGVAVSPAGNNTSTAATGSGKSVAGAINDVAAAQAENKSPLPPPTGFVNDYAKVIDEQTQNDLETSLDKLKKDTKIEFAVVTVDTTGEQPTSDYAIAVARGWGIGPKDQTGGGLILLIAIQDRRWAIRWSPSLNADLENGTEEDLTREMTGLFRQGNYSRGIANGVKAVMSKLANHSDSLTN